MVAHDILAVRVEVRFLYVQPSSTHKLPKRCLIGYDDKIEKIYSNEKEIISDGFSPKLVLMVCKGELKTHKHRKFKFLE